MSSNPDLKLPPIQTLSRTSSSDLTWLLPDLVDLKLEERLDNLYLRYRATDPGSANQVWVHQFSGITADAWVDLERRFG